jgi:ABC-type polysaccharide/polyol phosphate transport system ATPase subunit
MPVNTQTTDPAVPASPTATDAAVIVEVRGLDKTFRVPDHRVDSLKERALHPLRRVHSRELRALRDVAFDVRQGEFFGIVGRNGSGKSTLLKILASIYRADSGRVRLGGRLAPFIELGVGFNPELTSRENVVLNGVMMGLSRREAQRRLEAVLEFAELEPFADLKLKNYSSGMMVRLAFSVMVQADADIMLIDEVLAVGDAAFAQKCMDVFTEKRRAGRTIILVTHDMITVQALCDRALVLHDGRLDYVGDPQEAARRYFRINFADTVSGSGGEELRRGVPDVNARLIDAWLEDARGKRIENVEQGEPIRFNMVIEARQDLHRPIFGFLFRTADGDDVFGFNHTMEVPHEGDDMIPAGRRVTISGSIENRLLPGRYVVEGWTARNRTHGDLALHALRLFDFVVYGNEPGFGRVSVEADVSVELEPEDGQ